MPLLLIVALGVGAGGGFIAGKGAEGAGNIVKWGVIGGLAFLAYKHVKG